MTAATTAGTERDRLVRRNTILLAFAQGFVQTTFPVMLVIGGPACVPARGTGRGGRAPVGALLPRGRRAVPR